jgi:hypothetical protein
VALLDLPLDPRTLPLLNEVSARLSRRGPGIVEALLEAALGDAPPELGLRDVISVAGAVGALLEAATRSPNVPPRTENALSVLDAMAEGDAILGLIEVLEGPHERLKKVASELLVEIGDAAVGRLQMSMHDRDAEPWVTDTLVDIRERSDPGGYGSDEADDDLGEDAPVAPSGVPADDLHRADAPTDDLGRADAPADGGSGDAPSDLPSADSIGREYDDFIARFKRETGQR